jgi:hypothetical protein
MIIEPQPPGTDFGKTSRPLAFERRAPSQAAINAGLMEQRIAQG